MNLPSRSRSTISYLLALAIAVALAACGAQAGDSASSQTSLPTFSKDRVAKEAPVEVRRMFAGDGGFDFGRRQGPRPLAGPGCIAPSPDGRYLTEPRRTDVEVHDLATGEWRRITNNVPGPNSPIPTPYPDCSIFSPDGNRIAYSWHTSRDEADPTWTYEEGWDLRTIGIDGTDMQVHLSRDQGQGRYAKPMDWSKDGRHILSSLWMDEVQRIITLDVATNEIRVLKTLDEGRTGPIRSFFSPDDRFVAFNLPAARDSREYDIYLMSSDGSQETTLIQTPNHEELLGWLPDGSGILFHRDAEDSQAIWKLPLRDGQPTGPPELVKDDVWDMIPFGFSDDAYFYGVTASQPGVHIASFDLETGRVLEALEPVSDPPGLLSDLASWSPDGTRIAYFSAVRGRNDKRRPTRIIVRSVTGEILQDLPSPLEFPARTSGWTAQGLVVWARDRASAEEDPFGFYLISLETGEATLLWRNQAGPLQRSFSVSDDGSSVFISEAIDRDSNRSEPIYEYDLSTRTDPVLVEQNEYSVVGFPDATDVRVLGKMVSPDGDNILYYAETRGDPSGDNGLAEIFSRSSGESRVIYRGAGLGHVQWSPDGRYVVASRGSRPEPFQLIRISVEDRSVISLAEGPGPFLRIKLSPDGRHISWTMGEERQEIWRMTFNSGR